MIKQGGSVMPQHVTEVKVSTRPFLEKYLQSVTLSPAQIIMIVVVLPPLRGIVLVFQFGM
jgi:hypothetical protein